MSFLFKNKKKKEIPHKSASRLQTKIRRHSHQGNSAWFVIAILFIIGYFGYTFFSQQAHLNAIDKDMEIAQKRLEEAQKRNDILKAEYAGLQEASYIEKVAREDLGMTRRGEMPYIVSQKK